MIPDYINIIFYVMWGLLVFSSICFFISGLDDLFIDVYYWIYFVWRYRHITEDKKLTYETLAKLPQKRIAVMVACWHEAGVIEEMLAYNAQAIDYKNYDIFVGAYPNDPTTIAAVQGVANHYPHIHCVVGDMSGPTSKASNLNSIYQAITEYENNNNVQYDIYVMHDSEDIIHSYSFMLYNYLIPKNDMVQIPIFPFTVGLHQLTHWTYNAEFSEIHTKDMVVREKIGGLVPSAGVGTAFSRIAMALLKKLNNNAPFSNNSLTEDYSTALKIKLHGLKQIFVLQYVYKLAWSKRWYFFGRLIPVHYRECVATRAMFPLEYFKAVRQKTRWILGIGFQEWIASGWRGNFPVVYTLIHDRKSIFTHIINGIFFIEIPFWLSYQFYIYDLPEYPSLQDMFDAYPWVWIFIGFSSVFMVNRFLERSIALFRVYGFLPTLLCGPLILYGNIINLHALLRAYAAFLFTQKNKISPIVWDKTDHLFPKHDLLTIHKTRLGDMLLTNELLSEDKLIHALSEQTKTGEQLGDVLIRLGYLNSDQLTKLLAEQYHINIISKENINLIPLEELPKISKHHYNLAITNHCYPINIENNMLTMGLDGRFNEETLLYFTKLMQPYHIKFVILK